jgi:hypothetical protein
MQRVQIKIGNPIPLQKPHFHPNSRTELWFTKGGGSQLIHICPIDTALQAVSQLPTLTASPVVQSWTAADPALDTSTVINHTLTLDLHPVPEIQRDANIYSQAHKSRVWNFPTRPSKRGYQPTDRFEPHQAELSALTATCYPIIMIHLSSAHGDELSSDYVHTQGHHLTKRGNCKD